MLAKAAFRRKPPTTRVVPSWSLDETLEVLVKIPQERLGPKETFYKALFLTAVASSNRSSELAAIDRNRIELRQSSIVLPSDYLIVTRWRTKHKKVTLRKSSSRY